MNRDVDHDFLRDSEGITTTKASTSRVQIILLVLAQQRHMLPLLLTRHRGLRKKIVPKLVHESSMHKATQGSHYHTIILVK